MVVSSGALQAHRRQGARAKFAGEAFEQWLTGQHDAALFKRQLAWWRHVSPHVRWVGKGKAARALVVGEACADYVGQLADGRALVVEAKSVKAPGRLAICDVQPQQRKHLGACAKAGGLALLLVEFRAMDEPFGLHARARFAVPWDQVPWVVRRTAQTIGPEELCGWEAAAPVYLERFTGECRA